MHERLMGFTHPTDLTLNLVWRSALSNAEGEALWALQQQAYRVEADLIGCADFLPLRETVNDILGARENFLLAYDHKQLAGALSYTTGEPGCHICRLVVAPSYFRRGIARWMLHNLLLSADPALPCRVVTAQANHPAIALYHSLGFAPALYFASQDCVDLVQLLRPAPAL